MNPTKTIFVIALLILFLNVVSARSGDSGRITVTSSPSGAAVYLIPNSNEQYTPLVFLGITPMIEVRAKVGTYGIIVYSPNRRIYRSCFQFVTISKDTLTTLDVTLQTRNTPKPPIQWCLPP